MRTSFVYVIFPQRLPARPIEPDRRLEGAADLSEGCHGNAFGRRQKISCDEEMNWHRRWFSGVVLCLIATILGQSDSATGQKLDAHLSYTPPLIYLLSFALLSCDKFGGLIGRFAYNTNNPSGGTVAGETCRPTL
jgi:hypothetical protein